MSYFNNHISHFVAFVIALQILNMSIDAPAAQMVTGKANAEEFNYIDTYVEYVAEIIFKFNNAIPESKNREQKELQQHKQFQIAIDQKTNSIEHILWEDVLITLSQHSSDKHAYQFIKEINPPPPKA